MLDDFKNDYKIAYRILVNALKKDRCSHAYLFETNGTFDKEKIIMSFVKSLLCPFHYTNKNNCQSCFQCKNIDENNYLEIKIIKPDGMWIKKEQLLDLQQEFKTKGIENQKKVYVVYEAEKMNSSSANSLLKFLEEPQDNIVAILVTDNAHQLLSTIVSRCQIITLNNNQLNQKKDIKNLLSKKYEDEEQINSIIDNTIEFITTLEKNKNYTIINEKSLFFDKFQDKNDMITFFEIILFYYKDVINLKLNRSLDFFEEEMIKNICQENTLEQLNKKIKILLDAKEKIKVNANMNLLIDKFIIDIGEI